MKDQIFTLAKIKIKKVRSATKIGWGVSYKDKLWVVDIDDGHTRTTYNVASKREFWKRLKEELYL